MTDIYTKYLATSICSSLIRNINENFKNISYAVYENGDISIKFILTEFTEIENEYINDTMAEIESYAIDVNARIFNPYIEVGDSEPFRNIVFEKI